MSSVLQAIPTEHGLDVLSGTLKSTVTKYALWGATTHDATKISAFHSATIESSYFDDNGVLTFQLNLPIETDFKEYLHKIVVLDKSDKVVIECATPKVALAKGIGGMVTLKAAVSGEAGEVVFKSSEFVTKSELNELFLEPIHRRFVGENLLINGDFSINQRGVNPYTPPHYNSLEYTVDRFRLRNRDDGNQSMYTATQMTKNNKNVYRLDITNSISKHNVGYCYLSQIVENGTKYLDSELTCSITCSTSSFAELVLKLYTPTPETRVTYITRIQLTGDENVRTYSVTIPAFKGAPQDHLICELLFSLADNSSSMSENYALDTWFTGNELDLESNAGLVKGDYLDIYSVKLERGNKATQFIPDHPAVNLSKCYRYAEKVNIASISKSDDIAKRAYVEINYTPKRTIPAATEQLLTYSDHNTWTDVSMVRAQSISTSASLIELSLPLTTEQLMKGTIFLDAEI